MGEPSRHPLVQTYGIATLRHLLNSPVSAIEDRFGEAQSALSSEAEAALGLLQQVESTLPGSPENDFFRPIERSRLLSRYHEEEGTTLADAIRQSAGGSKQTFNGADELERALVELAWHAYPLLTIQDTHPRQDLPVHVINWESPVRNRFETALFNDPDLQPLFSEQEDHGDHRGFAYTSTGSGGTTQVFGFADRILSSSWKLAHFRNEVPTEEEFLTAVRELFNALRSAMRGEPATVPVRVGLAGVLPPDGMTTTDWKWAQIRPADNRDTRFSQQTPFDGENDALHYTDSDGKDIQIRYSGDLVVEIDLPYQIEATRTPGDNGHPENPFSEWRTVEETIDNLRLALLLTGKAENITVVPTWQTIVDPLSHPNNIGWNDPRRSPRLLPTQLEQTQIDEWGEWAARIAATRTKGIEIAIRRILRAVAERQQAEDVLVDAIIVWENLFGAAQETMLRVTTAIAWLLGSSPQERLDLQKQYKKIYNQRSNIVHGNEAIKQHLTAEHAEDAIQISLALLRVVFRDRPDLLSMKDAAERSVAAILQTEPPPSIAIPSTPHSDRTNGSTSKPSRQSGPHIRLPFNPMGTTFHGPNP